MRDDLRHAVFALAKAPGFSALVLLTLALGVGANTAIFSVVNQVLLSPLPLPHPGELVRLYENHGQPLNLTGATFHDLRDRSRMLAHVAAYRTVFRNLADTRESSSPEQITAASVSQDFFALVQAHPQLGREFSAGDFADKAAPKIVVSDRLWRRMFGGDPQIVGRNVILHGQPSMVAGVMPPGFDFPENVDAWVPLAESQLFRQNRRSHLYRVIGRLAPSATVAQANVELRMLGPAIEADSRSVDPSLSLSAVDLRESIVGDVRRPLLLLVGAVGFVLLIACANVVNLQLTRSVSKQKEIATKLALGASRLRIVRYAASESFWLALGGGILGCLFGFWAVRGVAVAYPGAIPRLDKAVLDPRVMLFAAAMACIAALIAGVLPALHMSSIDPCAALGSSARTTDDRSRKRLRSSLLVAEMALAIVLLAGAGLLIRSFLRLQSVDPGYDAHNVAVIPLALPDARYSTFAQRVQFADTVIANLAGVPGVRTVAAAGVLPLSGSPETGFEIEPRQSGASTQEVPAQVFTATPEYFQTLSIRLLAGRMFTAQDSASSPIVALINRTMARKYFDGEDPIGRKITMKDWNEPLPAQIIGIVGDIRQDSLDNSAKPAVYFAYRQFTRGTLVTYFLARTGPVPSTLGDLLRERIWAVDRQIPVRITSMEEVISNSLVRRRFLMTLLLVFAALALTLATVGVYGVISYSVSQRAREFGIRFAVGAQRRQVLLLVLRQCLSVAGIGIAIGLLAAFALTRTLTSMLYEVSAADPFTFATITVLLGGVAVAAGLVPAVRAARTDPMVALRSE